MLAYYSKLLLDLSTGRVQLIRTSLVKYIVDFNLVRFGLIDALSSDL